jgi:hypothetical protein
VSNLHAIDEGTLVEEFGLFTTIPEPSAFALAALGMLGLMACARRRAWCPAGNRANHRLATPASLR